MIILWWSLLSSLSYLRSCQILMLWIITRRFVNISLSPFFVYFQYFFTRNMYVLNTDVLLRLSLTKSDVIMTPEFRSVTKKRHFKLHYYQCWDIHVKGVVPTCVMLMFLAKFCETKIERKVEFRNLRNLIFVNFVWIWDYSRL